MRTKQAIKYFKSVPALADALGITRQAVSQWGEFVPRGKAFELQILTGGGLRVGPGSMKG